MGYQQVHVTISKKDGKMSIEGAGFVGNQCDVLSDVEAQLGKVTATEDKPERFQYIQPDYVPNSLAN